MKRFTFICLILAFAVTAWAGSYTTNFRLYKPSKGEVNWGDKVNSSNWDNLDNIISSGQSTVSSHITNTNNPHNVTAAQLNLDDIIAGVASFGSRTGTVIPQSSDYAAYYKDIAYAPAWGDITGKPTTLSGYGITDAATLGHNHSGTYLTPNGDGSLLFGLLYSQLTGTPTWNQNTTGTAAGLTSAYIDWNAGSGGASILNKPPIPTISDTAYDATTWNGSVDGASKNTIRDKFESLVSVQSLTCSGTDRFSAVNAGVFTCSTTGSVSGYATVEDDGTPLTQRSTINFTGAGIACADLSSETTCTVDAGLMVYPDAGVPNSSGSGWLTSYTVGTAANNLVQLNASAQLPAVSAALLTNFPTLNQSTTGNAATATALAANGANCSSGYAPLGVDAAGAVESCFQISGVYAPLVSPALTGTPTAPTATQGTNNTQLATTAYVDTGLATKVTASTGTNCFHGEDGSSTTGCYSSWDQDFSANVLTFPSSTTLPATCSVGNIYMDTDATTGQRIYACESTNTWALQGDGGSGSVSDVAYASSWNGVTTVAPSKNAVYDKIEALQPLDADLTTLAGSTAWRLFYSNGSSAITELALGSSGQSLISNGPTSAPSFSTVSGSGTIGGSTGSTDNALLRADSTGGATVQATGITVDDNNVMTLPAQADGSNLISFTSNTSVTPTCAAGEYKLSVVGTEFKKCENGTTASIGSGAANIENEAFGSAWNGDTTNGAAKDNIYDWGHIFDTDDDGKVNVLDLTAGLVKTDANGVASVASAGTDYLAPTGNGSALTGLVYSQLTSTPTWNQNTTGSAATLTTPRAIYGNNFNGSAALTQVIASTYGGTGNGFTKFSGPTTAEKTFTLPDASVTLLYSGGALGTPSGGTLTNATGLPVSTGVSGLGTGVATFLATPSSANLASALTDETGTGLAVLGTSPTITTPTLTGPVTISGGSTQHVSTTGTGNEPTVSTCGTTPSIASGSTDFAGKVTLGTGSPTACTITFKNAFTNIPACVCSAQGSVVSCELSAESTTALTFTLSATTTKLNYICVGLNE